MKLIVGLGNPRSKYEKTRHNLGFMVIDFLIEDEQIDSKKAKLIKPQTFMNNSGLEVKKNSDYYKIKPEDIIVIHDDIDLLLGEIKVQQGRNSAGHKGVQSVIDALGTNNFTRIRIGIRPIDPEIIIDTEKFVLQKFTPEEQKIINQTIKKAAQIIQATL
ncbi:aminoacyl-tRNA hydrolase [Patescibacteria group bacterium]|nr:aminoacyl-tRNA hydrolase [Patescibacteria group bacterium]MBU1563498.1 aminoacyl-tRNA hydrolase [Patescibacteria group bacterium]